MIKYSTPSIEVVTFNPADAARIGMQWWVQTSSSSPTGDFVALGSWTPDGVWTTPLGNPADMTHTNLQCSAVQKYLINMANVPGNYTTPVYGTEYLIIGDDGQSC